MKVQFFIYISLLLSFSTTFLAQPSFNTGPGCSGGNCHNLNTGALTLTALNNLQVSVKVNGVSGGKRLAGELVDANNNVVDVVNNTTSNPFILTAPQVGAYSVNAGYKSPLNYGTATVEFTATSINIPTPSNARNTFELYPNHPNPFNHETIIKFSLPKTAQVDLTIFDINGRYIRQLASQYFPAGIHSLRWDGRNDQGSLVASGTYLCQIKSGEQRAVRSVIFAK